MKAVILAGGLGTRLSEETELKPKPMVEIGGRPMLWHVMKIYSSYGFNDFIICAGYKSWLVKEFFHHYYMHLTDVTFDLEKNTQHYHHSHAEPWRVTVVDTGLNSMTGGRLARVREYLGDERFFLTYGDGVGNIDIPALLEFHKKSGRLATVTAVQPAGKFGALVLDHEQVTSFQEKPQGDGAWINAGFFVLEPGIFEYIKGGDATIWEREPLESIARAGQLGAYKHTGFWKPMDTLRDKLELEAFWNSAKAPWKNWD